MSVDIEVMDNGFTPVRRGRHPLVKIDPIVDRAVAAEGKWVHLICSEPEAHSVLRQISNKWENIETASATRKDGRKDVYVRLEV